MALNLDALYVVRIPHFKVLLRECDNVCHFLC